ncbi:MAG TPA: hypothetical protein VG820_02810 [Fimbriimonadaceae bacterium]|nr:hypothetical protein [Fimbriimonadaceae bacterium]
MRIALALLAILLLSLVGCGGSSNAATSITITPGAASLLPGGQQQFTVAQTTLVDWSAPDGGTIVDGLFTAPALPGTYRVVATDMINPLVSSSVNVTVANVQVTVTPPLLIVTKNSVNTNAFTATIAGSADKAVTWSIDGSGGGAIADGSADGSGNARGTYTAGANAGVFTIRATSHADPTVSGIAQVRVLGNSALAVSPTAVTLTPVAPNNTAIFSVTYTDSAGAIDTTTDLIWDIPINPVGATLSGTDKRQRTFTVPTTWSGAATCQVRIRTAQGQAVLATVQVVPG